MRFNMGSGYDDDYMESHRHHQRDMADRMPRMMHNERMMSSYMRGGIEQNPDAEIVHSMSTNGITSTYFSDGTMFHDLRGWSRFANPEDEGKILMIRNIFRVLSIIGTVLIIFAVFTDRFSTAIVLPTMVLLFFSFAGKGAAYSLMRIRYKRNKKRSSKESKETLHLSSLEDSNEKIVNPYQRGSTPNSLDSTRDRHEIDYIPPAPEIYDPQSPSINKSSSSRSREDELDDLERILDEYDENHQSNGDADYTEDDSSLDMVDAPRNFVDDEDFSNYLPPNSYMPEEFAKSIYDEKMMETYNDIEHSPDAERMYSSGSGIDKETFFTDGTVFHYTRGWSRYAEISEMDKILKIRNSMTRWVMFGLAVTAFGSLVFIIPFPPLLFVFAAGIAITIIVALIGGAKLSSMHKNYKKRQESHMITSLSSLENLDDE